MAAQVLPVSSGSFLDSPVFESRRPVLTPPSSFLRRDVSDGDVDHAPLCSQTTPLIPAEAPPTEQPDTDQSDVTVCGPETPDSGFSTTPRKSPESDRWTDHVTETTTPPQDNEDTPPRECVTSTGLRKRKTVNFDESQTSVVVISPDDLYKTYAQSQELSDLTGTVTSHPPEVALSSTRSPAAGDLHLDPSQGHEVEGHPGRPLVLDACTGWPLKRSESLESRDNPFLPGGDLSREAEDLLSKATIIRDNFYLKEDEKQALLSQHQVQGLTDDLPKDANDSRAAAVEERVTQQLASSVSSAPPPASSPRLNGKAGETRENATDDAIPQAKNSPLAGGLNVHDAEKKRGNKCCSLM